MEGAKTIVLKFGGSAFSPESLKPFAQRVHAFAAAGAKVVVVHGGGKDISAVLERLGKKSVFIDGLRVTDDETLDVAEMVLSGRVNKTLVRSLLAEGVHAVGLSGVDDAMLLARPLVAESTDSQGRTFRVEYGHVGEVESARTGLLETLLRQDYVPVISPLGINSQGQPLNLNADTAAAALAGALRADTFLLLTDVPGVLVEGKGTPQVAPQLTRSQVDELTRAGVITGGMRPKVACCLTALALGAKSARIASLEDFVNSPAPTGTQIVEA